MMVVLNGESCVCNGVDLMAVARFCAGFEQTSYVSANPVAWLSINIGIELYSFVPIYGSGTPSFVESITGLDYQELDTKMRLCAKRFLITPHRRKGGCLRMYLQGI